MKKIMVILSLMILVLFMVGCTTTSTKSTSKCPSESPHYWKSDGLCHSKPPASTETKTTTKDTTYSINQAIKVDYLTYTVKKAETFTEMGTTFMEKETTGKFIKVYLEIMNDAKETKQIFTPRFRIKDNQDRVYDQLTDDMFYIADYLEWGIQLQPGLSVSGAIVFELPKDSTNLQLLIMGDWVSITEVKVSLDTIPDIGKDTTQQDDTDAQMEELMGQCSSPFKCTSSCPEYMDMGQKDCPSGQLCCME